MVRSTGPEGILNPSHTINNYTYNFHVGFKGFKINVGGKIGVSITVNSPFIVIISNVHPEVSLILNKMEIYIVALNKMYSGSSVHAFLEVLYLK